MSIYNSQIKTHIIDPVYNSGNFRAEYRLPPSTVFLSNLRMVGLGATSTGGSTIYNKALGSQGVIKQITLMDDNQVLDQLLEAPYWMTFKNLNRKNQDNMDLEQNLKKNTLGNSWNGGNVANGLGQKIDEYSVAGCLCDINAPNALTNPTDTSFLNLSEVFPLLSNLKSLPTTVFKNLKVIIEYNTDPDFFVRDNSKVPFTTTEAQLIADEVVGEIGKGKLGNFSGVSYTSIEHDRVTIPAIKVADGLTATSPTLTKNQTVHINGFNNKSVGRMLIVKSPTVDATFKTGNVNFRYGKTGSKCCNKEVLQVRVNGSSKIAGKGITGANQRLGMVGDVWGKLSIAPFHNGESYLEEDGVDRANLVNDGQRTISEVDYYGININSKVEDLQVDFQRQGVYLYVSNASVVATDNIATDACSNNQTLNFNLFCEVYKQIIPNDGGYNVVYV